MRSEIQRRLQQLVAYLRTVVGSDDPLLKALLKRMAEEGTGPAPDGPRRVRTVERARIKERLPQGLWAQ